MPRTTEFWMPKYLPIVMLALIGIAAGPNQAEEKNDPLQELRQAVEGTWVRKAQSPQGPVTVIKTHSKGSTTFKALDAVGDVLTAKTSKYQIRRSGNVNGVSPLGPQGNNQGSEPATPPNAPSSVGARKATGPGVDERSAWPTS